MSICPFEFVITLEKYYCVPFAIFSKHLSHRMTKQRDDVCLSISVEDDV